MLSIHLGDYPGSIYDTETYFRNSYLDSWFEDPMAAQIIKGSVRPNLTRSAVRRTGK